MKTSSTAVKYHIKNTNHTKPTVAIIIVTKSRNFTEIYVIADTTIIGKIRKTMKFIMTLKFNIKIKKNNFTVVLGFSIASFVDSQIAWNTLWFSKIIKNFE